jgi:hypothetical protein
MRNGLGWPSCARGWAFALCVLGVLVVAPAAQAQFNITNWRAQVYDADAVTEAQETDENVFDLAGGHPYIGVTDFSLNGLSNARNIRVDVPPGLVPNPDLAPKCPLAQLESNTCPANTQIGTEQLTILTPAPVVVKVPLYNVEVEDDQVSRFGFNPSEAAPAAGLVSAPLAAALGALHAVEIIGGVRDSLADANPPGSAANPFPADFGLFFTISDSPAAPPVVRSKLTFWGVPGDPLHAGELRQGCVTVAALPAPVCLGAPGPGEPVPDPDLPWLSAPTECDGQKLFTRLIIEAHNGEFDSELEETPTRNGNDGPQDCANVPFATNMQVAPVVAEPDSPTGPELTLEVPQTGLQDKDVRTTAHLKGVSVTLPPGLTINPSAANGLEACTDAQLEANPGVVEGDECPEASKIGTVALNTPLLPNAPGQSVDMTGSAFVGQPLPGDRYRLFLTTEARGVSVRLKGSVRPDPSTGQITAVFDEGNPQLPFDTLAVDLRDGSRAPLATPLDCGSYTVSGAFTPYSSPSPFTSGAGFDIAGAGCPAAFQPLFGARAGTPTSGAFSPLVVTIGRDDRTQYLSGATVSLPTGFGAIIRGVDQCTNAQAASGSCPPGSRIGTAATMAGAGSEPFGLSGPVYLTGAYKGAPFGMAVVIRAIAGPFDLGTVIVRQAIFVDPEDAHLTVVSDPLPTILEGVPIRLRSVDIAIDRSQFAYNPTSCGSKQVGAALRSTQGASADRSAGLSFSGCEALPFRPKMSMRLTGAKRMIPGRHPGLEVRVTQTEPEANIASTKVKLPKSIALDPNNAQSVCGFDASLRADCPASSRIGRAVAVSPALNRRLTGPVYFVQGIRIDPNTGRRIRTLPSLLAKLRGEVAINLRGTTDVEGGRLVSTFGAVPDAPVSSFNLKLKGAKGGILVATGERSICDRRRVSAVQMTGHNGKQFNPRLKMKAPCRRPDLKIRRVGAGEEQLVVRGSIKKKAKGQLEAVLLCGDTRVTKKAKRSRPGRWGSTLALRGDCADADKARVRVIYAGGGDFRQAVRGRKIAL